MADRFEDVATLFVPQYGLTIERRDVVPFLWAFGLLDRVLDRVVARRAAMNPSFQLGNDEELVREAAQRRLVRFQKGAGIYSASALELVLNGMRIDRATLEDVVTDRAILETQRAVLLADEERLVQDILADLMVDGTATSFLVRVAAFRRGALSAMEDGLSATEELRAEASRFLASAHGWSGRHALSPPPDGGGLADERMTEVLGCIGLAQADHLVRSKGRDPREPPAAWRQLCSPRPKAEGERARSMGASMTVERAMSLKTKAGITRVADITGLDVLGIPVVSVVRPATRTANSVSSGKGLTQSDALASGLMEAIEVYCAERPRSSGAEIVRRAYADVAEDTRFVDPRSLVLSSFAATFDRHVELDWIRGTSLMTGEPRWVPLEVVAMAEVELLLNASQTTNGLASGNNMEEAICHALCEVIERDAAKVAFFGLVEAGAAPGDLGVALMQRAGLPPRVEEVVAKLEGSGLEVKLLDCTSDLRVPTIWCVLLEESRMPDAPCGHPMDGLVALCGFGTHPDPEVACLRSLTEAAQTHTVNIQGAREDLAKYASSGSYRVRSPGRDEAGWELGFQDIPVYFRRFAEVLFSRRTPTRALGDVAGLVSGDVLDDLEFILQNLWKSGLREAVYVDLTQADIGVAVARVVVPGLEPIDLDRTGERCLRQLLSAASIGHAALERGGLW